MHARWTVSLGMALTAWVSVAAVESTPSYSLSEIRRIARSAHPTLESAQAAVQAAEGALRQARAYPNPGLVLGAGRGQPRDGGDSRSENGIALVQPIEVNGIRKWRARSAELQLRAVDLDSVLAETVVDSTVSRLVYTVLLERQRSEIARGSAQVAQQLHELLQRRVEIGESSPLEAVKARSEWFARRGDLIAAESAWVAARSALDLFCGRRLLPGYRIAESLEGPGVQALPTDLVERLHGGNPLLLRAEVAVEKAGAQTRIARKELFPRFDVMVSHETELDRKGWTVGVGLALPLWNRNRGEIAASAARQSGVSSQARSLRIELETSLAQASAAYRGARDQLGLHLEGWTASARQSLDIATFSFENGEASLLDVLDAQRSYLGVSLAEAESWAALAFARAEIERLIAGRLELEIADESE